MTSNPTSARRPALIAAAAGLTATALLPSLLLPLSAAADDAAEAPPTAAADTTAPTSTAHRSTPPASGWHPAAQTVRIIVDDDASGIADLIVELDGVRSSHPGVQDLSVSVAGDGVHTIRFWAVDGAGNVEAPHEVVEQIDGTAPAVHVESPASIELGSSVPLVIACSDVASGVAVCTSNLGDDAVLPADALGSRTIEVHAVDVAGNATTVPFTYEVVEPAPAPVPAVFISLPTEPGSGWHDRAVDVAILPVDDAVMIRWAFGGATTGGGSADAASGVSIPITADGETTLTAWAIGADGTTGPERTVTVRVDTIVPTITVASEPIVTPGFEHPGAIPQFVVGTDAEIVVQCADEHAGVSLCGTQLPLTAGLTTSSDPIVLDTAGLGLHELTVRAADRAGHVVERVLTYRVVAAPVVDPGTDPGPTPRPGGPVPVWQRPTPAVGADRLQRTGAQPATAGAIVLVAGLLAAGAMMLTSERRRR